MLALRACVPPIWAAAACANAVKLSLCAFHNDLVVGAVDDQDQFTTFTTSGENVEFYANGYRIPSLVPGGRVIPFSGTSMAAPQVANLAAKILAIRPDFKPADVIAAIRTNADPIPDKPGRFIINPKRTIEAVRTQK
jgi:hypothetical protein